MESTISTDWEEGTFQQILHAFPNGVVILDQVGKILYANPLAAQLLAEPLQASYGEAFGYQFTPNGTTNLEMRTEAGLNMIEMQASPLDIDGQQLQLISLRDITAEQQFKEDAQRALEKMKYAWEDSEEKFRAVFEYSPDAIMLIDVETAIITDCNQVACDMNGFPREEMVGQPISLFDMDSGDGESVLDSHRRYLKRVRAAGVLKYETHHLHKDGSIFPIEVSTTIITLNDREMLLGIDRDISERKRTESALQLANEKLNQWVHELELRNQQSNLVNEMSNMLESCQVVGDAYRVFGHFAKSMFPENAGHLFILSESRNMLEAAASWGWKKGGTNWLENKLVFPPEDCWGIRRGLPHVIAHSGDLLYCDHLELTDSDELHPYLCVPIMAQGEMLGVLHLQTTANMDIKKEERFAKEVAERFGLRLANLKMRESLHQQSIRDPLTGMFNRRYMEETLEREIRRAIRHDRSLGIIMIDLDRFKHFNDTFGHHAGDALLQEIGLYLQTNIRSEDIACRYGGEEFLLILTESTLEASIDVAEKLREGIKHLRIQYRREALGTVTASMGIASFPEHGSSMQVVLETADAALLQAKKAGRDKVVVADKRKR